MAMPMTPLKNKIIISCCEKIGIGILNTIIVNIKPKTPTKFFNACYSIKQAYRL